jgi:hypothetical protein
VGVDLPAGEGWGETATAPLPFIAGTNTLVLKAEDCAACRVKAVEVEPRS